MKNIGLFIVGVFATLLGFGQIDEINSSTIQRVDVYQNGALITRSFSLSENGDYQLKGISPNIIRESIEFSGNSKFNVHNIQSFTMRRTTAKVAPKAQVILDNLNRKKYDLETREQMRQVYETEKQMLVSNQNIIGKGANVADLEELLGYTRTKLKELNLKLYEIDQEKKSINEAIEALRIQLNQLGMQEEQYDGVLTFRISDMTKPSEVNVSYFVRGPRWQASYHLTDMENGTLVLEKKAVVHNNSPEDWSNVELTLNSGRPNLVSQLPQLQSNVLGQKQRRPMAYALKSQAGPEMIMDDMAVAEAETSTEGVFYQITKAQSVKSFTSEEFTLDAQDLVATLSYLAIPKVDPAVYVHGVFTSSKFLEAGPIWVYRKNKLVGKSIMTAPTNGVYHVSLGKATHVEVQRTEVNNQDSRGNLLSSNKIRKTYRIQIKSKGNVKLPIELKDQLPISTDTDIEITPENLGGAELNAETGELKWNFPLNGGVQNVEFSYTIKYPKGYKL